MHPQFGKRYTAHQMGSIYLASGTFGDWLVEQGSYVHVQYVPVLECQRQSLTC